MKKFDMATAQAMYNRMGKYKSRKWQGWLVIVICSLAAGIGNYIDPEIALALITTATTVYQVIEGKVDSDRAKTNVPLEEQIAELHKTIEELENTINGNQLK